MKILNPPSLKAGDVIICPKCDQKIGKVNHDVLPGLTPYVMDLDVLFGTTNIVDSQVVCSRCGTKIRNDNSLAAVNRYPQPVDPTCTGENGLD